MDPVRESADKSVDAPVPGAAHLQLTRGMHGAGGAARAVQRELWDYVLPPKVARAILALLPLLAAVDVVWAQLTSGPSVSWPTIAASVLTNGSIIAMAWRPTWGAIVLVLAGFVAVVAGQSGEYLTAVAMSIGVVFYCCSAVFSTAYGVAAVAWVAAIATVPPGLDVGGVVAVFVVGLLSATVGRGLRRVVRRNVVLASQVDAHEAQLDAALLAERTRIADELHDVIAHEISITVMHARVLERTDDPEIRSSSQRAIVAASAQALTDTRRVLQLIHGRTGTDGVTDAGAPGIRREVDSLAQKLRDLGHTVRTEVTGDAALAGIIETTLTRAAREAVTNIVKHGAPAMTIDLSLVVTPHTVVLSVINDPHRPVSGQRPGPAFGLARLRERVEVLSGTFAAGPDEGRWRVRVELPTR
ncbi:sensor histidine kinase [Microbacterium sp. 11MF]|uniref:sensor histidine kinase n=1 Tax=Microbacterium sp. 11MF TaxID=1169146 RepID=UPI00039FAEFD|nr:histidine kinase [Microbacterium sp. 11MF]